MLAQQVAHKYARALFLSAKERTLLDATYEQAQALQQVVDAERPLLPLLSGPQLSEEEKIALVRRVFSGRINQLHVEFLIVLIQKRRISFLPEILTELVHLIEIEKGITRAEVTTALELDRGEENRLLERIRSLTGNEILLERKVDPSIIGGMIVRLRDDVIDGSVRRAVDRLRERLMRVRVH